MKIKEIFDFVDGVKPNAFSNTQKTMWLNEVEGMVQTDVMLLASVMQYVYSATSTQSMAFTDSTILFTTQPHFHAGGKITITGLTTLTDNNVSGKVIRDISSDGLTYTFDAGTFDAGTESGTITFDGSDTELLVNPPHQKIYYTYLMAMIDFANGEYDKYQNTVALFNTFFGEFTKWFIDNFHPADGECEERGYYISAYAIAVKHGYVGTEEEWLASLEGDQAKSTTDAQAAASSALESKNAAAESETNAGNSASAASSSASSSNGSAQTATTKAMEALQSAETAASARDAAVSAKTDAQTAASSAQSSASSASSSAQTAVTKAEESTTAAASAKTSETTTTQAMSDYLAMLGVDVATLTGGKLTLSQLPAIAITNPLVVNSEAAMLALDAQTGDIAIRTDISDTFVLATDDPATLSNWVKLLKPTNYADTAGYAETAGTAANADKINNHRTVEMIDPQFKDAVKDADTYYYVYPEAQS